MPTVPNPPPAHRGTRDPTVATRGNRLLAALTPGERDLLAPASQTVDLVRGETLLAAGEEAGYVFLPHSGLVSLRVELPDGTGAEAMMVGHEGVVALPALLGVPRLPYRAVVRVPGSAQRVGVTALRPLVERSANLRGLVHRLAVASHAQMAANAVCNALHPLEQRVARWLLAAQDRVGPGFPVTQDELAAALGARRPTVNDMLRGLAAAGLIRQARGRIAVADGTGLAARACACRVHALAPSGALQPRKTAQRHTAQSLDPSASDPSLRPRV